MGRRYDFKYLVIGGGPAGSAAAMALAKAKKSVGLVEGGPYGGSSPNNHDIPDAVALEFAHTYYKALCLPALDLDNTSFNLAPLNAQQAKALLEVSNNNNPKTAEETGLIYIKGYADFLDPHTILIRDTGQQFTAENFILATGARLGLDTGITSHGTVNCLSPRIALKVHRLPETILVIGGGSSGCEIAEYYATLGANVVILEQTSRLLPREDPEVGATIQAHFRNDLGIMTLTNAKVIAVAHDPISKYAVFTNDGAQKMVRTNAIVLATGFVPDLDYGLENTGVKFNQDGSLQVDKFFRTSVKHIFAVGDCALGRSSSILNGPTAKPAGKNAKKQPTSDSPKPVTSKSIFAPSSSTERAAYEGRLLASFLVSKSKTQPNYQGIPRLTNTIPSVACFGPTEATLRRQHIRCRKAIIKLCDTPAGKIHGTRFGFVKLIADRSDHLISAQIVSENAADLASELSLAIRHHLTAIELASTPHPINDFSYAIQLAAKRLISVKK